MVADQNNSTQVIDPITFNLRGSSLIEASAGTGKTWTIAALYVRLVLGHSGLIARLPEEILVLTFTKAAAKELRDRIRRRLLQAANYFADSNAASDEFLIELKNSIDSVQHTACVRVLNLAAQSMDLAAISTIHAWCHMVLQQHAFDSNGMFEQSLQENTSAEKHIAAWDYWRSHVAGLSLQHLAEIKKICSGPNVLKKLVKDVDITNLSGLANYELADFIEQEFISTAKQLEQYKAYWRTEIDNFADWINSFFNNRSKSSAKRWLQQIRDWAFSTEINKLDIKKGWERFSVADIQAIYGPDITIIEACIQLEQLHGFLLRPNEIRTGFYKHAFYWVNYNYQQILKTRSSLDFNSILLNLQAALYGSNGEHLAMVLRQQFPTVLIDEFQDTDPVQYSIFNRIYNVAANQQNSTVVFIGDPKQSIYRFRGADIYTYLQAAADCNGRVYTLEKNFRSAQAMVNAVNQIFTIQEQQPFITGVKDKTISFSPVQANGINEEFLVKQQAVKPVNFFNLGMAAEKSLGIGEYRKQSAQLCADKICELLNQAQKQQAVLRSDLGEEAVQPADIAILVNQHTEASLIQQALSNNGIRSVYYSEKKSVFACAQAHELLLWLQACLEPQNSGLLRAALATPSFGLSWHELEQLSSNELVWDTYVEKFIGYRQLWQSRGVLPMIYNLLHDFAIPARLLQDQYLGERNLTNILHLAEILQKFSIEHDSALALIRYMQEQMLNGDDSSNLLRLESDADLVKIVTIHKSKGLEYPIVFLPFVSAGIEKSNIDIPAQLHLADGSEWCFDLSPEQIEDYYTDALGEDVRKLYVALTRARHAVWLSIKPANEGRICALDFITGNKPIDAFTQLKDKYKNLFSSSEPAATGVKLSPVAAPLPSPKPVLQLSRPAIVKNWWVSSYSALGLAGKEDNKNREIDNYLEYKLQEELIAVATDNTETYNHNTEQHTATTGLQTIPKGSITGTLLHDILQFAADRQFQAAAETHNFIEKKCTAMGWQQHTEVIQNWLTTYINRTWPIKINQSSFNFNNLPSSLAEMEFLVPVHNLDVSAIDKLISASFYPEYKRPALASGHLNGMFKGYIDLCFQNTDGKYYLLDYKSNYLGDYISDYEDKHLIKAMLAMRYDVQMVLYLLALHRQLQARLVDYDYEQHLGGAIYMFLRGYESSNQGLLSFKPDVSLITSLSALFAGGGN